MVDREKLREGPSPQAVGETPELLVVSALFPFVCDIRYDLIKVGGTPIFVALAVLRSVPQTGSQFHELATANHEISGLE